MMNEIIYILKICISYPLKVNYRGKIALSILSDLDLSHNIPPVGMTVPAPLVVVSLLPSKILDVGKSKYLNSSQQFITYYKIKQIQCCL